MNGCYNSNSTQYERNGRFEQLAFALDQKGNGAKLPSVGLGLNASKSSSTGAKSPVYDLRWMKCCAFQSGLVVMIHYLCS